MISPYSFPGIRELDLPVELIQKKVSALKEISGVMSHDIISEAIKEVLGLDYSKFKTSKRDRHLVEARMVYIYLTRTYLGWSLKEIGIALSRDHTTIIHNLESYHAMCVEDPNFQIRSNRITLLAKYKSSQLAKLT